jgi:hypothetical protein
MKIMKPETDTPSGNQILQRMDGMLSTVLKVSHPEILRREAEYLKTANLNPRKRGPKPKKPSASLDPHAEPQA